MAPPASGPRDVHAGTGAGGCGGAAARYGGATSRRRTGCLACPVTLALAGLAGWALWTPQLPRDSGRSLAALLGLGLLGSLAVAAGRLPFHAIEGFAMPFVLALALCSTLALVGWRWSRREISW